MPVGDDMRIEEKYGRWFVFWGDEQVHFHCETEHQAVGFAFVAQWAAKKTVEKLGEK